MLANVSNATWELECRILTATARASPEGKSGKGPALARTHVSGDGVKQIDRLLLREAARRRTGADVTNQREILYILSDLKTNQTQFALKTANMCDGTLRACNAAAQEKGYISLLQVEICEAKQKETDTLAHCKLGAGGRINYTCPVTAKGGEFKKDSQTKVARRINLDGTRDPKAAAPTTVSIFQAMGEQIVYRGRENTPSYAKQSYNACYENALDGLQREGRHPATTRAAAKDPSPRYINGE